jgi:hypothetical protein
MHILTKCTVQEAKSPVKISSIYIYVKFLALLGAPYICDISRLRVKCQHFGTLCLFYGTQKKAHDCTTPVEAWWRASKYKTNPTKI